ncbi:hypothetical protein Tco_0077685 [Tanacetum coccineum]
MRCISQTKRHNLKLVMPKPSSECGLLGIFFKRTLRLDDNTDLRCQYDKLPVLRGAAPVPIDSKEFHLSGVGGILTGKSSGILHRKVLNYW